MKISISNYRLYCLCLALCLVSTYSFAQKSKSLPPYQNEWLYGLNFNTNGGLIGGIYLKYATASGPRSYHSFPIELLNVKHPKELKVFPLSGTSSYVQGKSNYFYLIRPQYGYERILFKKAKQQGVQINAYVGVGPAIGIVAPYLISYNGEVTQFDPRVHNQNPNLIEGAFDFTRSISEASFKLGASFKASLYFELGTSKKNVGGFEAGFSLDAFKDDIVIMPEAVNRNIFPTAYISFFYGIRN